MILFSLGTEKFPFNRLVKAAERVATRFKEESVFVQLGYSTVLPQGCDWIRFLSYRELMDRMAKARIVVTHAGAGSILSCLRSGKRPIVVPRRRKFGEHVDDHQGELATRMAELGYLELAEETDSILPLILKNREGRFQTKEFSNRIPSLVLSLSEFLGNLAPSSVRPVEAMVER